MINSKVQRRAPLGRRAALARVNRRLAAQQQVVRVAAGARRDVLGRYYLLDLSSRSVREANVDLEKMARQMGAMEDWEEVR